MHRDQAALIALLDGDITRLKNLAGDDLRLADLPSDRASKVTTHRHMDVTQHDVLELWHCAMREPDVVVLGYDPENDAKTDDEGAH